MDEEIKIKIEELPKPKLIEDLGMLFITKDSKHKRRYMVFMSAAFVGLILGLEQLV